MSTMRLDSASRAYCKCRAWVYKLAHMTTAYDVGEIPPIGVHHRLRIAREWANLEQSELSERTGISRTSISAVEKGKTKPRKIPMRDQAAAKSAPTERAAPLVRVEFDDWRHAHRECRALAYP